MLTPIQTRLSATYMTTDHKSPVPKRSCSLEIVSKDLEPRRVSEIVEIQPDKEHRRGDLQQSGTPRFQGVWVIDSSYHITSVELADHLAYIEEFVRAHRLRLREAKRLTGARVSIRLFCEFESTISITIENSLLKEEFIDGLHISIV